MIDAVIHPNRANANRAVHKAVRNGTLQRQPCEWCGAAGKVHAHHEDYDFPLAIVWLCPRHHSWFIVVSWAAESQTMIEQFKKRVHELFEQRKG